MKKTHAVKPCPFCGNFPRIRKAPPVRPRKGAAVDTGFFVQCNCAAHPCVQALDVTRAVKCWNERPDLDTADVEVERS